MAFVPVPNTVRVSVEFSWNTVTAIITLYFEKGSAWASANVTSLMDAIEGWLDTDLMPSLSEDIGAVALNVLDLSSETAPSYQRAISPVILGGLEIASVPLSVAPTITFLTDLRGRSFRGRNYLPGITAAAQQSPGLLDLGAAADYAVAYDGLDDVETAADCTWVVVSRVADGVDRVTGVTTPITGIRVNAPLRSQRRREIGVGE